MKQSGRFRSPRGSITLVALCFVTVMAIGLASYLAISSQSMKLSNRSYAKDVSKQLAEKGLEVALLALKTNNWDDWTANSTSADWTLSGTTATCTITYPSNSYGTSGMTATTKIRVDNYNAYNQAATWSNSTSYKLNDVVGYNGLWYTCVQANTNQTPTATGNLAYWVPAPIPWKRNPDNTYSIYDVVNYNGTWYRCVVATSATPNPNLTTPWAPIPSMSNWSSVTAYTANTVVSYDADGDGVPTTYRCILANTNQAPPNATYWSTTVNSISLSWSNTAVYTVGSFVFSNGTWYRCTTTNTNQSPPNTTYWNASTAAPYISWAYRSAATYEFNDVVFYSSSGSGTWYRRKVDSSTIAAPTNTTYWENALNDSWDWDSADNYNIGDVVCVSGSFYRCIRAHSNQTPPNTTYWSPDPLKSTDWDIGKNYNQYDTVRYRGNWYLSLTSSNTGNNPTTASSTYWAIAPRSVSAWDSAKTYSIDDIVSSGGAWYRCIVNHTNQAVSSTTYWSPITGADYAWTASPASAYTNTSYVNYGGVWYDCILAPTANQSPNNATYWTALGAPVIYAEGTATLPLQVTSAGVQQFAALTTQLRATASPAPLFPNAVAATGTVTIGGAGTVDSYDASAASVSTGGVQSPFTYNGTSSPGAPSTTNQGYAATIASSYSGATAINGGTGTVQGYLAAPSASTSPYAPLSSFNGTLIGTSAGTGIDLTRISRSPYIPNFSILPAIVQTTLPSTIPTDLSLGTPGSPAPSYYYDTSPTIGTNIYINGPVIWYISGNLRVNTGDTITINSTGSLTVYLTSSTTGRLRVESTGGGIVNKTLDPKKLVIIGDTISTSTQYYSHTGAAFYGVIYLPSTTTATGLTIADSVDIRGALSAAEITFSGAATVHYDTSLRYATFPGIDTPFQLDQWRELTDTTERAGL